MGLSRLWELLQKSLQNLGKIMATPEKAKQLTFTPGVETNEWVTRRWRMMAMIRYVDGDDLYPWAFIKSKCQVLGKSYRMVASLSLNLTLLFNSWPSTPSTRPNGQAIRSVGLITIPTPYQFLRGMPTERAGGRFSSPKYNPDAVGQPYLTIPYMSSVLQEMCREGFLFLPCNN